ncbi:MAG: NnrS family protein [Sphingomonadales bacterium]|nr:NnrS family protein [Sphingomonadales bacterium]
MVKPAIVFVAPHRLPFLVGTVQLGALMLWWLVALSGLHFGTAAPPGDTIPPSLLHAPLLMYLAIPPFFFGFLLTVFPRWMGYPDLTKTAYAPVGFGYAAAAVTSWWGLGAGSDFVVVIAFALALIACLWGQVRYCRLPCASDATVKTDMAWLVNPRCLCVRTWGADRFPDFSGAAFGDRHIADRQPAWLMGVPAARVPDRLSPYGALFCGQCG